MRNFEEQFNFDKKDKPKSLAQQKQEIFDQWDAHDKKLEGGINPIKQTLNVHIDPSQFANNQWYLRNEYKDGVDLYVNKEIGKFLKTFEINGKTSIIQEYDGRKFVIAKVGTVEQPFYSSSQGTDEKEKGAWYPFYGFSESGWVMKDGFNKDGNWIYNKEADPALQAKIKEMAEELTRNISLPISTENFVSNLCEYFEYQTLDDKTARKVINNALGLPKDIDTKNITDGSGYEELANIKKYLLKKHS